MAYANSAGLDQTALPIWVYTNCYSTEHLKQTLHKKANFSKKKVWNKVFEILEYLQ